MLSVHAVTRSISFMQLECFLSEIKSEFIEIYVTSFTAVDLCFNETIVLNLLMK